MENGLTIPDSKEVGEVKLFQNSIFPADYQKVLVEEIRNKAIAALNEQKLDSPYDKKPRKWNFDRKNKQNPNRFYLVTHQKYYDGGQNIPFTLTVNPFRYPVGEFHSVGPIDITLASALAYIDQEELVLLGHERHPIEEVKKILHVNFAHAYAQGLSYIVGHLGNSRIHFSKLPMEVYISTVLQNSRNTLLAESDRSRKDLEFYKKEFSYSPGMISEANDRFLQTLDRITGFDQGKLLLQELLEFNWQLKG